MDDSSASSAVAGKEETLPSTTSSDSTNINQTELSNFILECRPTLLQSRCWRNFKIDAKFLPSKNYQLRNLLSACLTSSAFSYRMTCTCGRALLIYTVSILPQQRDSLSLSCCALSLLYEPYQFLIGRLFRPWAQPWFSRRKKAGMEISLSLSVGDFFTYSGEKVERKKKQLLMWREFVNQTTRKHIRRTTRASKKLKTLAIRNCTWLLSFRTEKTKNTLNSRSTIYKLQENQFPRWANPNSFRDGRVIIDYSPCSSNFSWGFFFLPQRS